MKMKVHNYKIFILRTVVFVFGIAMLSIGIWQGELTEIMHKGIVVCLECIGIG